MQRITIKNKRIAVTGGAGVIGLELLNLLSNEKANVLSIDRRPFPEGYRSKVSHVRKDLTTDTLDELRDFDPQVILHLAATFERSTESPEFLDTNWSDNVLLSHRLVDLARQMPGLEVFVFASSYLVYSPSLYLSPSLRKRATYLKEDSLVRPRNLCGAAKYYTESEIDFIRTSRPSLRTVHARIFRVFGCGSKDVISRWARAGLSGKEIEVYNRENRFDYIFARDVAEGLLRLAQSPDAKGPVNLGAGKARSIQDVLDCLTKYLPSTGLRVRNVKVKEPFEASCADLEKLRQMTGWAPPTTLEKGIKTIVEFEQAKVGTETTRG